MVARVSGHHREASRLVVILGVRRDPCFVVVNIHGCLWIIYVRELVGVQEKRLWRLLYTKFYCEFCRGILYLVGVWFLTESGMMFCAQLGDEQLSMASRLLLAALLRRLLLTDAEVDLLLAAFQGTQGIKSRSVMRLYDGSGFVSRGCLLLVRMRSVRGTKM